MLRGSKIIFTVINSKLLLKHQISWKKWGSVILVAAGLTIVGLADILQPTDINGEITSNLTSSAFVSDADIKIEGINDCNLRGKVLSNEIIGDIMIIIASLFASFQYVYEEKILNVYDVSPLEVVGWEGFYGFIMMFILLIPLSYIDTGSCLFSNSPKPPWTLENTSDAFIQLSNNDLLLFLFCSFIVLIAFHNYGGIVLTKQFNATTNQILDSSRCVIVWTVSLCLGWQQFKYLQLIGFCVMTTGIFMYNFKWNNK